MKDIKKVLLPEIEEFRKVGHKFVNGEISVMDFKGQSGGMGVYAHRGGKEFMIRLRIPSGIITMPQFKLICDWADKYKLGGLHFTTRQAIQYHGISIDDVCNGHGADRQKGTEDSHEYTHHRVRGLKFPIGTIEIAPSSFTLRLLKSNSNS